MSFENFKLRVCVVRVGFVLLLLFSAGVVTHPLEDAAWKEVKHRMPGSLRMENLEPALGQGLVLGIFGGFRSLMGDIFFIQGYSSWEKRNAEKMQEKFRLATSVSPDLLFFWLNWARMVGYDLPIWRIYERGGFDAVPDSIQKRLKQEDALKALRILDEAELYHPNHYKIALERAFFYMERIDNKEIAAEWFLQASLMEGVPHYAARLHARMLEDIGEQEKAHAFLCNLLPTLSATDPQAARVAVLERIRELEEELDTPFYARLPLQPEERGPLNP